MRTRNQLVLLALIGVAAFAGTALVDRLFVNGRDGATQQLRKPRARRSQPIPINPDAPPAARLLRFPQKAPAGVCDTAEWSTFMHSWGHKAMPARGDVRIPAGQSVKLGLYPAKPTIWQRALSKLGNIHSDPRPCWDALGALNPGDVQALELQDVTLCGNDLANVAKLTGLRELYMKRVSLQSARLNHLSKIESLRVLVITSASVGEAGAKQIARLHELKFLLLDDVGLTDKALRHLSALPQIDSLYLLANKITDNGLARLKKLTSLRTLSLANNTGVTDEGMKSIGEMTGLIGLNLSGTNVGDAGLAHLENLTHLAYIQMQGANVTDAGLVHLYGMKKLRWLDLRGCRGITPQGIEAFREAVPSCPVFHHAGR